MPPILVHDYFHGRKREQVSFPLKICAGTKLCNLCSFEQFLAVLCRFVPFCEGWCRFVPFCAAVPFFFGPTVTRPLAIVDKNRGQLVSIAPLSPRNKLLDSSRCTSRQDSSPSLWRERINRQKMFPPVQNQPFY